jgi:hypothetical protein
VDRDEEAPLIRCDLPEFERTLLGVGPDCAWADAGIVDEDIDAAKLAARGLSDCIRRGVVGQIGRNGQ